MMVANGKHETDAGANNNKSRQDKRNGCIYDTYQDCGY